LFAFQIYWRGLTQHWGNRGDKNSPGVPASTDPAAAPQPGRDRWACPINIDPPPSPLLPLGPGEGSRATLVFLFHLSEGGGGEGRPAPQERGS
jgi:hypothetical protein